MLILSYKWGLSELCVFHQNSFWRFKFHAGPFDLSAAALSELWTLQTLSYFLSKHWQSYFFKKKKKKAQTVPIFIISLCGYTAMLSNSSCGHYQVIKYTLSPCNSIHTTDGLPAFKKRFREMLGGLSVKERVGLNILGVSCTVLQNYRLCDSFVNAVYKLM